MVTSITVKLIGCKAFAKFHFLTANSAQMHDAVQMLQAIGSSFDGFSYALTNVGIAPMNIAIWQQTMAVNALPVRCHSRIPATAPAMLTHSTYPMDIFPNITARTVITQAPVTAPKS